MVVEMVHRNLCIGFRFFKIIPDTIYRKMNLFSNDEVAYKRVPKAPIFFRYISYQFKNLSYKIYNDKMTANCKQS